MTTWFTSDTHFGHANIPTYQPNRLVEFEMHGPNDIQKMNEMMVRQWNSQVAPDDTVYHLGDFAMGKIDETLPYVGRLNGRIHLILGNHDRPHPIMSKTDEKRERWEAAYLDAGFQSLALTDRLWFDDGVPVELSHFPYTGDHDGFDRYQSHRPPDTGGILLHGHVHGMWQRNGRMINVGIDAHGGRLLSYDDVMVFIGQAVSEL